MHRALSGIVAAATVGGVMAFAGPALGNTNTPIAQTGGAVVVIPLMGSPLTVTVALDTTTGNITSVNLTPPAGFTATTVSPSRVGFDKGTDGATRLGIRAKGSQLSVSVRSTKLDDLLGNGTWTADVFGTSGVKSVVAYTIAKTGTGDPVVTITSATTPAPGTFVIEPPVAASSHDEESSASASVTFTNDGFVKKLTIGVGVETDSDHAGEAKLRLTLSGHDVQTKALSDLAGAHAWNGTLCDGTKASFAYTVSAGTLTAGIATPTADIKSGMLHGEHEDNSSGPGIPFVSARFSTGDSVQITLKVTGPDGALGTHVHAAHCGTPPSDPTVNTPTSLKPKDDNGNDKNAHDNNGHDNNGNHKGKSD